MEKRLILFPSTQPNVFTGVNETEGEYCKRVCDKAKALLQSWDWQVEMPWQFDFNGDLRELVAQKNRGLVLQAQGQWLVLSVHCNWTGTASKDGTVMIYRASRPKDRVWADSFGRIFGDFSGLDYKNTYDESITAVQKLAIMSVPGPNILLEMGEFGTATEARWLMSNESKLAAALATAVEKSANIVYGTPLASEDDMAVDNVSEATWRPWAEKLVAAGIITKLEAHNMTDAAGMSVLLTLLGRGLEKAGVLPKAEA